MQGKEQFYQEHVFDLVVEKQSRMKHEVVSLLPMAAIATIGLLLGVLYRAWVIGVPAILLGLVGAGWCLRGLRDANLIDTRHRP